MDLPHDLAVKALLLEKTCDLDRQFGEKHLEIGQVSDRLTQAVGDALVTGLGASRAAVLRKAGIRSARMCIFARRCALAAFSLTISATAQNSPVSGQTLAGGD